MAKTTDPTSLASTPLPTGRRAEGGLTKDDVVRIQRSRMLFAMAEAASDQGYANVVVTDVVKRAGVSRATFYEQFTDKQDCFLAAFDTALEVLFGEVGQLGDGPADGASGQELFPVLLKNYLDGITKHEAFARVFLIDIYAVGPEGARRRADSQRQFAELLAALFGATNERDRFACHALVAATSSMVMTRLAAGDLDGIRGLHAPLVELATSLLGA